MISRLLCGCGHSAGVELRNYWRTKYWRTEKELNGYRSRYNIAKITYQPEIMNSNLKSEITILSRVSHELKTPLAAILGYAEFIAMQAANLEECREAASIILDNSDYLLQILDELLEADKPDNLSGNSGERSGGAKLADKKQRADIAGMVRGVYRMFSNSAVVKGLFFTVSCSTPIPRIIVTEIIRVRQVLINLVGNAIKFTASGGVRIVLSWQKDDSSDAIFTTGIFRIDVCDSGVGISPEVLPRLFTAYQQADRTIKTRFGGTGLGLAISQKIANQLGGEIIVANNTDGGSTFSFLFPVKLGGEVEFISDLFSGVENCGGVGGVVGGRDDIVGGCDGEVLLVGCRVLLVEDSVELCRLFGLILGNAGAMVEYTDNGEAAFDLAMSEKFDVILMDVGLPLGDGYSVVRRLRDAGYKGQIIAVTADDSFESREKSKQAGCNTFAAKPIFRNELIKLIKSNYR
ncbi:MAG: hybrid sensor histidine kinase/response regulator [Planctomycetaceae bacterium]|nr:hybrid sensor histidine kinase/response regulator [Planctomycetaceae bacterium]